MEIGSNIYVDSPDVKYSNDFIDANYEYSTTTVEKIEQKLVVRPVKSQLKIRTGRNVGRVGVMLVGWGGNNGSTLTASLLAHKQKLTWNTKRGLQTPNWYGSLTQCSTLRLGVDTETGKDLHVPLSSILPMLAPNDIVIIDGWDISSVNLAAAMERAQVLDYNLQQQLKPFMETMRPRPSVYYPDFIAANQAERVDNLLQGSKWEQLKAIRRDIQLVKEANNLDKVIVMWTANTERFSSIIEGVNDTADNLIQAIMNEHQEVSPSTLFAVASILEGCTYINGSPQNTFVPGCIELAEREGVFIGGDDFKSGQTKVKSVLVDFLISAGIKPVSIVSYNHLGNNDGKNLSASKQFKSKEISKSSVVDDIVSSNSILYKPGENIDHIVVIKYAPYVGDSKRAMDEYVSEIMLGGHNTIAIHNTCEDSLLATPIMLDLIVLAELASRIQFKAVHTGSDGGRGDTVDDDNEGYTKFHSVLSILSYLCKAPLVPRGSPVVNALMKQRACIENILRACLGLPPEHSMSLEHKLPRHLFKHLTSVVTPDGQC